MAIFDILLRLTIPAFLILRVVDVELSVLHLIVLLCQLSLIILPMVRISLLLVLVLIENVFRMKLVCMLLIQLNYPVKTIRYFGLLHLFLLVLSQESLWLVKWILDVSADVGRADDAYIVLVNIVGSLFLWLVIEDHMHPLKR